MNRPRPEYRPGTTGFAAVVDRTAVKIGQDNWWISKLDVRKVIDAFGEELFAAVRKSGHLTWPKRGSFYVKRRKARRIANPQTGVPMKLPASIGMGFRAAKAEKARLRGE